MLHAFQMEFVLCFSMSFTLHPEIFSLISHFSLALIIIAIIIIISHCIFICYLKHPLVV